VKITQLGYWMDFTGLFPASQVNSLTFGQEFGHFQEGCHRERERSDLNARLGDCHAPYGARNDSMNGYCPNFSLNIGTLNTFWCMASEAI
jgi:hypothetical protein